MKKLTLVSLLLFGLMFVAPATSQAGIFFGFSLGGPRHFHRGHHGMHFSPGRRVYVHRGPYVRRGYPVAARRVYYRRGYRY